MPLFLLSPALTTPLLKVPILLTNGVLGYVNVRPPRDMPGEHERKVRDETDFLSCGTGRKMFVVRLHAVMICGVTFAEAATILAQSYPSSELSCNVLDALVPAGSPNPISLGFSPSFMLGSVLILVGGTLRIWSYRTLGRFFVTEVSVQKNHELVSWGPYAIVRHPSYLAAMVVGLGEYLALFSPHSYPGEVLFRCQPKLRNAVIGVYVAFWAFSGFVALKRTKKEDAILHAEFGEKWEEWARRTPYRLIPYIW
ncbi:ICMT-domain-containing protein [Fomes fomentarius]|nr:ICMT-domain-containing protein [Fomes fomentarius]